MSKIFEYVMGEQRKAELDLYRLLSQDEAFKIAMHDTIKRMLWLSNSLLAGKG